MKRFVVVGLGGFGSWVARMLYQEGFDVIAIDRDENLVDRHASDVTRCVGGDATDENLLREVGVEDADAAVVAIGEDLAATILSILALRDTGVEHIYAKVSSIRAAEALERFDLVDMVFPEREAAERLVRRLSSSAVLDHISIGTDYAIQEIAIPDAWIGKTLLELALPKTLGVQIVALHDVLLGEWSVVLDPGEVLKESDVALVAGKAEVLDNLLRRPGHRSRRESR